MGIQIETVPQLATTVDTLRGTEKQVLETPNTTFQFPQGKPRSFPKYGDDLLIVVPTQNEFKVQTISKWAKQHAKTNYHVIQIDADSRVGEQPYNEQGFIGAWNRIQSALDCLEKEKQHVFEEHNVGTVVVAAIENFMQVDIDAEQVEKAADYGVVVVHNATTSITERAVSKGVTINPAYVNLARSYGFDDNEGKHGRVTVGEVLSHHVPSLDHKNWHEVVANVSRYALLTEAMGEIKDTVLRG